MDSHDQLTTRVVAVMAEAIRAAMERATATMLESPDNQLNPEATRSGITFLMLTAAHDVSVAFDGEEKTRSSLNILAMTPDASSDFGFAKRRPMPPASHRS